ncbi:MAG: phosphoglycolate phosphatase [Pseudomonadota bacterium]
MSDLCTRDGANHLASRIQDFWRKRGFDVIVEMRECGFVPTMRSGRTDVRSDMINGMPVRSIVAEAH